MTSERRPSHEWVADPDQATIRLRRTGFLVERGTHGQRMTLHAIRNRDRMKIEIQYALRSGRPLRGIARHPMLGNARLAQASRRGHQALASFLDAAICACQDCLKELRGWEGM